MQTAGKQQNYSPATKVVRIEFREYVSAQGSCDELLVLSQPGQMWDLLCETFGALTNYKQSMSVAKTRKIAVFNNEHA